MAVAGSTVASMESVRFILNLTSYMPSILQMSVNRKGTPCAACNSKCVFCLDAEAQDGRILAFDDITVEIDRGRIEKSATRIVLSGGEASIHPRFADCVRYAKAAGYGWVQTVTNGVRYADRDFYWAAVEAGLDEITFSLHGHTPELHDRLTRTKNGFASLMKAMIRAQRSGRVAKPVPDSG